MRIIFNFTDIIVSSNINGTAEWWELFNSQVFMIFVIDKYIQAADLSKSNFLNNWARIVLSITKNEINKEKFQALNQ